MQPLKLSPLPCAIPAEENPSVIRDECGFVDEAIVRALMAGPGFSPQFENRFLESTPGGNALDFAGWCLPTPAAAAIIPESTRRPSPPVLTEPAWVKPHLGPHRGWLAGMAGATCSLLFAALLIQLTTHVSRESEPFITIRPTNVVPATSEQDGDAPQLTRLHESSLPRPATGD